MPHLGRLIVCHKCPPWRLLRQVVRTQSVRYDSQSHTYLMKRRRNTTRGNLINNVSMGPAPLQADVVDSKVLGHVKRSLESTQ